MKHQARGSREQGTRSRAAKKHALAVLLLVLLPTPYTLFPRSASADVLDELRDKLFERRQALRDIEQRITAYRREVVEKREEASTLSSQLRVIDGQVTALRLELDKTEIEIEEAVAESQAIAEEIRRTEEAIDAKREQLREAVRLMQVLESDSIVEVFFKYPSLTNILTETRALERVQRRTTEALGAIKVLKGDLSTKADAVKDLERELRELSDRQERQKKTLEDQQAVKTRLFDITKAQEAEFQKLLNATAAQHRAAQAAIASIETEVRAELERQGLVRLGGVGVFDWPMDPIFGISCGFHCDGYPYRNILGPHTGIDIPAHLGTAVRAGAEGYVARAFDSGGPGYSYVLILHGENLSTVYGHLSSIAVSDGDFVARGQVVGSSGGIGRGAGLSTGPHLHFEVRSDGLPVDPARYLP